MGLTGLFAKKTKHSSRVSKPTHMDVSVVIPFFDEEESLPELYQQLTDVLTSTKWSYELIFVDDGSQDNGWEFVRSFAKNDASVRAVKFTRNFGKSQALHVGFDVC